MNYSMFIRWLRWCCYFGCLWMASGHSVYAQSPATDDAPAPQNLAELQAAVEKIRVDTQTPAIGIALVNSDGPQ